MTLDDCSGGSPEGGRSTIARHLYHLGNHQSSRRIAECAARSPDILVLHDVCCFQALPADERVSRWKGAGVWLRRVEDLLPWPASLLSEQRLIILHDPDQEERIRRMGVDTETRVVPMPVASPFALKTRAPGDRLIVGVFGHMGANRRITELEDILADRGIPLILVGEPPSGFTPRRETTRVTGRVDDAEWWRWIQRVSVAAVLRYPTMGETSLTALECLYAGTPVIAYDIASYANLPDEAVIKISPTEPLASSLAPILKELSEHPRELARRGNEGRSWVNRHHSPQRTSDAYARLLEG